MHPIVTIDLPKNPEVAALVADMEPSKRVFACFTIKDKDDQTLTLRLSEMAASPDELPKADEYAEEDDEEDDGTDEETSEKEKPEPKPEKTMGERMVEKMSGGMSDY